MSILPEGERPKRAILWISENLKEDPSRPVMKLVHQAIARFDLTPKESEELIQFYRSAERAGD
jgi:restriction endonuclease Mrr